MAVPKFFEFFEAFLKVINDNNLHTAKDVRNAIAKEMSLSDDDLAEMLPSGKQRTFDNRVAWARTYLNKAGLVETPSRGKYRITDEGKKALLSGEKIDLTYLEKSEEFKEFHKATTQNPTTDVIEEKDESPMEVLESAYSQVTATLASQLMDEVMKLTPVEFERLVEYGKGLSFHHNLDAFEENCRPLVLLVLEMVGTYREHYSQFRRSTLEMQPVLGELVLGKAGRERFFSIMEGKEIECEDSWKVKRNLTVKRENPKFEMTIEKTGKDGVKLTMPKEIMAFLGEKCLFIANDEAMYRCDEEYTQALHVLMEYMVMGTDAEREILINDRDMPLFYERVLKKLEALKLLNIKDLDLEGYRPQELKVNFYFDSNGPKEVTLRPELSYGDYSFHPLEDENVPREICRDVPGEFRVSQLITRYFKFTEEETNNMVIRGDDDAVYALVSDGMSRFMELGEVFVSESFKKIRVLPPTNVAVRVRATEGWLELDVDTGGIPKEELFAILAEYQAKKKFYRMKNGDFLTLGDDGLLTMSKLAQSLGVEKEFAAAEIMKVPMYRAMYLDAALKEDRSVSFYRDQLFKAVVRGM